MVFSVSWLPATTIRRRPRGPSMAGSKVRSTPILTADEGQMTKTACLQRLRALFAQCWMAHSLIKGAGYVRDNLLNSSSRPQTLCVSYLFLDFFQFCRALGSCQLVLLLVFFYICLCLYLHYIKCKVFNWGLFILHPLYKVCTPNCIAMFSSDLK